MSEGNILQRKEKNNLIIEIFLSIAIAYMAMLIFLLFTKGFLLDTLKMSFFFFPLFAAAPVLSIIKLVHPILAIVALVLITYFITKELHGKLRTAALSLLIMIWETYGMYCLTNFTLV
jgi:hypothetical protein